MNRKVKKVVTEVESVEKTEVKPLTIKKKERVYNWPDPSFCNGSGDCEKPAKILAGTIKVLGNIIIDCTHDICEAINTRN